MNGVTNKGTKTTSIYLRQKRSREKHFLTWTKNTWKMFWVLSMLKFNKDSWFSCNNAMSKAKKTAQFMDGVEMTSPNLVLILQIRSQTLIKLYFLKDTNFWDATIASLSFTTKKQGKSAWTQHFKANSHGNLCSGMFSTFGLSMLQETTWWFCVLFKRITFPNN